MALYPTRRAQAWLRPQRALAIFGVVALSLIAYLPEELLKHLGPALERRNPTALVAGGVACVFLIGLATVAYRQLTLRYPRSGDAYSVASDALGRLPRVITGSTLLMGYVLAIAVSASAGISALAAAWPALTPYHVMLTVGAILVSGLLHIRGRGLSTITYVLAGTLFGSTLLLTLALAARPVLYVEKGVVTPEHALDEAGRLLPSRSPAPILILAALATVSAMIIGVSILPRTRLASSHRAANLLLAGFGILLLLVGGTTWSAAFDTPAAGQSMLSHLAARVYGGNLGWYAVHATTAFVLLAAAQTPFPRVTNLMSVLARDGYMPPRFAGLHDPRTRADSGIILAAAATVVVLSVGANVSDLIPWYIASASTSFLLAQVGLVVRCLHLKLPGWRQTLLMHAIAGLAAGATLVILLGLTPTSTPVGIVLMSALVAWLLLAVRYARSPSGRSRRA